VSYTAVQAARLTGCTPSQLRYWARRGLVAPSEADGSAAGGFRYGFRDLIALRLVRSLLDAGLPSARVGVACRALVAAGDDLASLRLVTDGTDVWACRDDGQILDALRSGQLALFVAVDRLADDVEAQVARFDRERAEFVARLCASGEETESGSREHA
jgi:DNA-binding transcriptional MerR regulator